MSQGFMDLPGAIFLLPDSEFLVTGAWGFLSIVSHGMDSDYFTHSFLMTFIVGFENLPTTWAH